MHSNLVALFAAAGLASLAQAFTQPGAQTWGPLLTPDLSDPVTQGQDYTVTWDPQDHPTDGVTVSLVLCHGPGSNCVLSDSAIASGIPAAQKSYDWNVPCDLAPGTQSTDSGYGMLVIVDGTGEFQYSTQFSVLANKACGSSSSSNSTSSATTTITSSRSAIVIGPPAYATSTWTSGNFTWVSTITNSNWASVTASTTASSGSSYTWGGSTISATPSVYTSTAVVGGSTLATAASQTSVQGASGSATGAAASASTFVGSASQIERSLAGLVVAGAVAVFAL